MKLANKIVLVMLQFILLAQVGCSWSSILATVATIPAFMLAPMLSRGLLQPIVLIGVKAVPIWPLVILLMVSVAAPLHDAIAVMQHAMKKCRYRQVFFRLKEDRHVHTQSAADPAIAVCP